MSSSTTTIDLPKKITQLTALGQGTRQFDRLIDDEKDTYPTPLMSKSAPRVWEGIDKLWMAITYLRSGRVREIIESKEFDLTTERDYYGMTILLKITEHNHPSNISYSNNKELYETLFFTVLNTVSEDILRKLIEQLHVLETSWDCSLYQELLKNVSDRPFMLIALWNYGLNIKDFDYRESKHYEKNNTHNERNLLRLQAILGTVENLPFTVKKRYTLLNKTCPISHELINVPAILIDGTVYEYNCIKSYLTSRPVNPLTNEKLLANSGSLSRRKDDKSWMGCEVQCSVFYLPEQNMFEHFSV